MNKDIMASLKPNMDLSAEDLAMKQRLELYVEKVHDSEPGLQKVALESMRHEIRSSTSSMTAVPKPLKYLRPHYTALKSCYESMEASDLKTNMADILSVLALTMSAEGERESLKYRLLAGLDGDIGSWGHEYVRNLAAEITEDYADNELQFHISSEPMRLVRQIVEFHMRHNAETEAVDLLVEIGNHLNLLLEHVDDTNFKKTCLYLTSSARYLPARPDDAYLALDVAYKLYLKYGGYPNALQVALFFDDRQLIREVFRRCEDVLCKKQLCYMLARHGGNYSVLDDDEDEDANVDDDSDREGMQDILNNTMLSEGYHTLARDLEVMEAKTPHDIYKAHLLDGHVSGSAGSARQNLADTFVNAFVNAGFGEDKLMTAVEAPKDHWLFQNKGDGKMTAAASLGLMSLWNIESGFAHIDKYLHSNDNHVVAGALLGVGIFCCGVRHECDPALAVLGEFLENVDPSIRIGAIMGLGIAYAGSQNEQIGSQLTPILDDAKAPLEVVTFTAISLGLIFIGSCNEEVAQAIIFALTDRTEAELRDPLARLISVSLGLVFLGKQDNVEATAQVSETFNEKIRSHCDTTLLSCAYAGTGDVLKVQTLLGQCSQRIEEIGVNHQGPAVLGIAMIAMAEELGLEMAIRSLEHLLQYGQQDIRKAVPLALGLLCISNPKVNVMDTLSRLSHDTDAEVAMSAVVSLGLIGAGTNNARIAAMLRNLSTYYSKNADLLFCVRIAQGLIHLGKGLATLDPYYSDRFLLSPAALGGIIVMIHACLDMKAIILGKYHYVLYFLALAVQPRMLITVAENLKPLSVPVRVGKAVDVVGQAGHPKTITGFQTHSTPVVLAAGEKAELATQKYIPLSPFLEGFVILRENVDYRED